ncbi:hypothetical protein VB774_04965 [Pseudanabaena galeata UHCC 0370]|uniref:Uncharacterized protein n=1 Tax=Pseudanabaena galeata UHCC 0370 TaxID=3110310 RepID=A0ABU5TF98_9CYAN|nr:hypothetical protein [Pseudanabaena galeata]MEA5476965.1 hypothetical protein [Pseudanabaena galeata UHCC 0370]
MSNIVKNVSSATISDRFIMFVVVYPLAGVYCQLSGSCSCSTGNWRINIDEVSAITPQQTTASNSDRLNHQCF